MPEDGRACQPEDLWEDTVKALKSDPAFPVTAFMLPDDHPRIVAQRDALRSSRAAFEVSQLHAGDWCTAGGHRCAGGWCEH